MEFPLVTCVRFFAKEVAANWDYEEAFVTEVVGTVIGAISDNEETEFGTITLLKVSACEAANRHFSLLEICDSHSDFLVSAFTAILDANEETKDELEIEPGWCDLLVLWEFDVKPEYRKNSIVVKAFEAAMNFLGPRDLVVAAMEGEHYIGLELTIEEWRELGFKKVAGTQFVFRDSACLNPYTHPRPDNDDLDDDDDDDE